MTKIDDDDDDDDGGAAFPQAPTHSEGPDQHDFTWHHGAESGMSLRDWFAGQALSGVVVACAGDHRRIEQNIENYFAVKAYSVADAMIAARKKGPSDE